MSDKIITADDVLELLDKAVEDRGEKYRYPKKPVSWKNPYYGEQITDEQLRDGVIHTKDEKQDLDLEESGTCHYFATERDAALVKGIDEGAPMCIVGWVFDALGYQPDDLDRFSNIGMDAWRAAAKIAEVRPELGRFDKEALDILTDAQSEQDTGVPWGAARDVARREHLSRTDDL